MKYLVAGFKGGEGGGEENGHVGLYPVLSMALLVIYGACLSIVLFFILHKIGIFSRLSLSPALHI